VAACAAYDTIRYEVPVMLTRPAGHEAKAEATMYEAEARHVREQLSVYEHEDKDISVQNIVFSKQPIHNRNDCRWLYCEY